ncbi:apolipo protein O-domain-containing protein [Crucibulum laeve]|uniref:MICOS complex subunit n=1 Tax=Crucibulum laeve TaxID=68775 RepID=A0A5C3LLF6_9AGAR|nr:apolipo protein O-domain-containing protein [Crucibulum laeve]
MFRAASRLPQRTLLSASAAATALTLHEPQQKASIYPAPEPEILLVESPSPLEKHIGIARRQAQEAYSEAHAHVQGWVSKWIGVEHAVENRVKSIISPQESLTPGLLYVGIATLSGSIIARNRFLAARLLLPPTLLVLSANHFLPQTTANLSAYLASLEETYFPTLAEKHDIAKAHTAMTWERIKDATANGREQINRGAVVAVDKIQEATGLKIKETLGWSEGAFKRAEASAAAAVGVVEHKAAEAKTTVEKNVEETKVEVEKKVEEVKRIV